MALSVHTINLHPSMQVFITSPNCYHQAIIKALQASKFYKLTASTTGTGTIKINYDGMENNDYVFNHIRNLFWDYTKYRYPMQFVR